MKKKHKNNAFKTPENYFREFDDRLLARLEEEKSTLPGKDGMKVPDGYFDTLNEKITNRLLQTTIPRVVQMRPNRKYYFAAAAVAALFILVLGIQRFQNKELTFESLASSEIQNYLDETGLGLSSYEIAEVVVLDENTIENILEDQLMEENIIDYLDENVDDLNELNLELDE
ncbi:MAG: hypothetical protein KJN76_13990 [Eudoraea sp.]|nr:hypothetical protein [Eudoraea sp.]